MSANVHADDGTYERASLGFVQTYFEKWSSPNATALAFMNAVFPDQVEYFNLDMDHAQLMTAKRRFAERWPQRTFVARPDNITVTCDLQHLCTVWGLVDWRCLSSQRDKSAVGTSVFSFQVQDGQTMVSEDGFVISRGQIMPRQAPEIGLKFDHEDSPGAEANPVIYTNRDIPALRSQFFAESADRDWIGDWLRSRRRFAGSAHSLGASGLRSMADSNGGTLKYTIFAAEQGPIACMMSNDAPGIPQGSNVELQGVVSIFIDQTMYLTHCSVT